jgi:hypothetical protein
MTPKIFFMKISIWIFINAEFSADFKFVDAGFQKCPLKVKSKKPRKNGQKPKYTKFA